MILEAETGAPETGSDMLIVQHEVHSIDNLVTPIKVPFKNYLLSAAFQARS